MTITSDHLLFIMRAYKEIRVIYQPSDIEDEVNRELRHGWVVLGIEQKRLVSSCGTGFSDVTHYILGLKDED